MLKQILLLAAAATLSASAGVNTSRLHISNLGVNASEEAMTVNMTINPAEYKVKGNKYVRLTPVITNLTDSVCLSPVTVAGRNAWFYEVRGGNESPSLLRAGKGDPLQYSVTVPYQKWMEESQLAIVCDTLSECNCKPALSSTIPIGVINNRPPVFEPDRTTFLYDAPKGVPDKIFNISGRANIVFKVNKTDIDWNYMSNYAELDSIMKSINAVRDNMYATVDTIYLTGYASPEGAYSNNVRLAKGRTETVRKYVVKNSGNLKTVYETSSVPEDWAGLREWLVNSSIDNRDAIISFIDDASVPIEKKNDLLRSRFPAQYPFLLKNVYPHLRHTDYRIRYQIRKFYDVEEIAGILKTNPKLLSLNELYLLAEKYEPGSPEYDQVYLTAASMFPDNDVANLNAASSSMNQGNLQAAKMFLEKVKPSPEATYTRGIYYAMMKEYGKALEMLRKASKEGITKAEQVIPEVEEAANPAERFTEL